MKLLDASIKYKTCFKLYLSRVVLCSSILNANNGESYPTGVLNAMSHMRRPHPLSFMGDIGLDEVVDIYLNIGGIPRAHQGLSRFGLLRSG